MYVSHVRSDWINVRVHDSCMYGKPCREREIEIEIEIECARE